MLLQEQIETSINQRLDCVGWFRLNSGIQCQQDIGVNGFVVKAFVCYKCLTAVLINTSESQFKFNLARLWFNEISHFEFSYLLQLNGHK